MLKGGDMNKKSLIVLSVSYVFCVNASATNILNWADFSGVTDGVLTGDINVGGTQKVITVTNPAVFDGQKNSLNGNTGYYFNVSGNSDIKFKNFGLVVDGTGADDDIAYIGLDGNPLYKHIDKSVNSFANTGNNFGLIYNTVNGSKIGLENSAFYNNTSKNGGVTRTEATTELNVDNSQFISNSATSNGGVHYLSNTVNVIDIDNSIYTGNRAVNGGVLYSNGGALNITNSFFDSNEATQAGGSVYNKGNLQVADSVFSENRSVYGGSAIYTEAIDESTVNISGSLFVGNANGTSMGGTVSSKGLNTVVVDNSKFKENTTQHYGGALYMGGGFLTVKNSEFMGNQSGYTTTSSSKYGGAIYATSLNAAFSGLNIENTTFTENTTSGQGGAIYLSASANNIESTITDSTFDGNITKKGDGGAIVLDKGTLSITDSLFNENSSYGDGGAISVYSNGILNIDNVNFIENESTHGMGGAIDVASGGVLNIKNSMFKQNSTFDAEDDGAAIHLDTGTQAKIENTNFINNTGGWDGGAISNSGYITLIDNAVFDGNTTEKNGGAIWWGLRFSDDVLLKDSVFKNNYAKKNGGAILFENPDMPFVADNITFESNTSDTVGGAIYLLAPETDFTIKNSNFVGNIANYGGAAYLTSASNQTEFAPVTIIDTTFSNNTANEGGAIYNADNDLNIFAYDTDVVFSGNIANNMTDDYNAGSDLYFDITNRPGSLNLNATDGKKIVFNGSVAAYTEGDAPVINVNKSGLEFAGVNGQNISMGNTGEVQFNDFVGDSAYNFDINLYSGQLSVGQNSANNSNVTNADGYINYNNVYVLGNSMLNTVNGSIGDFSPVNFEIANGMNLLWNLDVDLENQVADRLKTTAMNGTITINNINVISDRLSNVSINIIDTENLDNVSLQQLTAYGPIYGYNLSYDSTNGTLNIVNQNANDNNNNAPESFNPNVLMAPIVAQVGGYLTQISNYNSVFDQMVLDGLSPRFDKIYSYTTNDGGVVFMKKMPRSIANAWAQPYASYGTVYLNHGLNVKNTTYGGQLGTTSRYFYITDSWVGSFGLYGGYNGSKQEYLSIPITTNGGNIGLIATLRNNNFFTGVTVNGTASVVESNTENLWLMSGGVANKIGYSINLDNDDVFHIVPSLVASYSVVKVFDYIDSNNVHITSDKLRALNIKPEIMLLANMNNGFQSNVSVAKNKTYMGKTKFFGNSNQLPEFNTKSYYEFNMGLNKQIANYSSVFVKGTITMGGIDGIGIKLGGQIKF